MGASTCLCHFPDGTEAVCRVDGDVLTRGSLVVIDGYEGPWYVTMHSPAAAEAVKSLDAIVWIEHEAPPPPVDH